MKDTARLIQQYFDYFMKALFLFSLLFISRLSFSQDTLAFVPEGEAKYFDFWPGKWYVMKDDLTIDSNAYFIVTKSIHPSCFFEEWHSNGSFSVALRAWDKTNNKWGFVWVSGNGLYQVWDTKKDNGNWYIYKQFTVNGDTYLSRQGFIPLPDGTVLRISEKTYDEKKWELRFKQRLKKVE